MAKKALADFHGTIAPSRWRPRRWRAFHGGRATRKSEIQFWRVLQLVAPTVSSFVVVLLFVSSPSFEPVAHGQDIENVATTAKPSVGVVFAERPDGTVTGTAFLVADQRAVTAYHVVDGARRILLKFPDSSAIESRVTSSDKNRDVAVLSAPNVPARPLPLADIARLRDGQTIVVIGYPRLDVLGAETATVTTGIISAVRPGLVQIQAPINPGNSGGPVLNLRGEVIGIVRFTLQGQQALNFATSIDAAGSLLSRSGLTLPVQAPAPAQPVPRPTPVPGTPPGQTPSLSPAPTGGQGIMPGQGIGKVRLGMTLEEAIEAMGRTYDLRQRLSSANYTYYYWYLDEPHTLAGNPRFVVFVNNTSARVIDIRIVGSFRFTTPAGNGVFSLPGTFTEEFGSPIRTTQDSVVAETYLRFRGGIYIYVSSDIVVRVGVVNP